MKSFTVPAGYTCNVVADRTLSLAPFGAPGTGKSRLFCSAPGKVGIVSLDKKTRFTVQQWRLSHPEDKDKFLIPNRDFIREDNRELDTMTPTASMAYYRKLMNDILQAATDLYNIKEVRTLVVDTGTVLFRNMYFAQYGRTTKIMPRDRSSVYQEFEDFCNRFQGKNFIITHQPSEIYENDKATGIMKPEGYKKLGHLVDTICEMKVSRKATKNPATAEAVTENPALGKYQLRITQSQSNPMLEGSIILGDADIDFPSLAMKLRPDSDVNDWL